MNGGAGGGMADAAGKDEGITLKTAIPWLLALATAAFGIWQFTAEQAQSNRVPFLTKQLEISFEASDAAARLATETDPDLWEGARKDFWRLYWGPLSVVEDQAVKDAMVALGKSVPRQPGPPVLPMASLQQLSFQLALAVRGQILRNWDVKLPALEGDRK